MRAFSFRAFAACLLVFIGTSFSLSAGEASRFLALCVGLNYPEQQSLRLTCSVKDAQEVAKAFTLASGLDMDLCDIEVMVDTDSGSRFAPDDIADRLAALASKAKPDDRLFFFYSGHGTSDDEGNSFIVCHGDGAGDGKGQNLPIARIRSILADSLTRRTLMIIDACHSGGKDFSSGTPPDSVGQSMNGEVSIPWLASCDVEEKSWENEEADLGLFTQFLLSAVSRDAEIADIDGDCWISAAEILRYVVNETASFLGRMDRQGKADPKFRQWRGRSQTPRGGIGRDLIDIPNVLQSRLDRINLFYIDDRLERMSADDEIVILLSKSRALFGAEDLEDLDDSARPDIEFSDFEKALTYLGDAVTKIAGNPGGFSQSVKSDVHYWPGVCYARLNARDWDDEEHTYGNLALQSFRKAADLGDKRALYELGQVYHIYYQYYGFSPSDDNFTIAEQYFRKSGEKGYLPALLAWSESRCSMDESEKRAIATEEKNEYGRPIQRLVEDDFSWRVGSVEKLVHSGSGQAALWLADLYESGERLPNPPCVMADIRAPLSFRKMYTSVTRAEEWLRKAIAYGENDGYLRLAELYSSGNGMDLPQLKEAEYWMMKLHDVVPLEEYARACRLFGYHLIDDGKQEEGYEWLERAAESGNADAAFELADEAIKGDAMSPDAGQAAYWYRIAREILEKTGGTETVANGNVSYAIKTWDHFHNSWNNSTPPVIFLEVAARFKTGDGVTKDALEARKWLRLGVDAGAEDCQLHLARDLVFDDEAPKNEREGAKMLRTLAGSAIYSKDRYYSEETIVAARLYGICLYDGLGVQKDVLEAIRYLQFAVDTGDQHAERVLASIGK